MNLYDTDFVAWTEEQAGKLRRLVESGSNVDLDLPNILEEIQDLGKEGPRAIRSALMRIIEHLLKLEHSPAGDPRRGWIETVRGQRTEIELRFEDSPSLRTPERLDALLTWAWRWGRREAVESLKLHGEADAAAAIPAECPYTLEQLLDFDWYPASRHGL